MARRGTQATHPFTDASRGVRIQKVLASAGYASRRKCEEAISQGLVRVNGHRIDALPAWIDPAQDRIEVDGRVLPTQQTKVYVMLFKPKGVVTTADDPEGRPSVVDLIEHPSGARLYPVGRLDMDSSGLLLMTNDGEMANRLTHPRYEMHKGYEVTVRGSLGPEEVRRLEAGIFLPEKRSPGGRAQASTLRVQSRGADSTILYMELREGRNRQIRRMLLDLGHPVRKLRRTRMGPLELRGLAVGAWRDLTGPEIGLLKRHAFADPATILKRRTVAERKAKARRDAPPAEASAGREEPKERFNRKGSRRPFRRGRSTGAKGRR